MLDWISERDDVRTEIIATNYLKFDKAEQNVDFCLRSLRFGGRFGKSLAFSTVDGFTTCKTYFAGHAKHKQTN